MKKLPPSRRHRPLRQRGAANDRHIERLLKSGKLRATAAGIVEVREGDEYRPVKVYPAPSNGSLRFCVPPDWKRWLSVHRVVAIAFHGRRTPFTDVIHRNERKGDNRPRNLRYEERTDTITRSMRNGRLSTVYKLSWSKAIEIRRRYADGESMGNLAQTYGVGVQAIADVVYWITWRNP